jgi:VanZ family protein
MKVIEVVDMAEDKCFRCGRDMKVKDTSICYVGAYCSHAVLTVKVGVYRCPFDSCFKRLK